MTEVDHHLRRAETKGRVSAILRIRLKGHLPAAVGGAEESGDGILLLHALNFLRSLWRR